MPFYDLLGDASALTGPSIQTHKTDFSAVHPMVLQWRRLSEEAGKPWACSVDEPGDAQHALVPDNDDPTHNDARINALWGAYMAGAWGIEWYFGYKHDHSDLSCQDFRSRDMFFDQCRASLRIMKQHDIPFWVMEPSDELITRGWCLAARNETYLLFIPTGGTTDLYLEEGTYDIKWFNPRTGEGPLTGNKKSVTAAGWKSIGNAPSDHEKDWIVMLEKRAFSDIGGKVIIEPEAMSPGGSWVVWRDHISYPFLEGFSGTGCIQFTGNSEVSGPADSPITIPFTIKKAGKYSLAIKGLEAPLETHEGDKANDCYVRLNGQDGWEGQDIKHVLLGPSYEWSWNVKGEPEHHDFHYPEYELDEGVHELVISGRSKNFFIDKVVLFNKDSFTREEI